MSEIRTPAEVLLNLVITLLAPLFISAANGDIAFARLAAAETINDYRAQTQADLITVAQIVAFGLTALASLSQSMEDDIPLALALRLRGNANACHRSAEQNRRALKENRPESQTVPPPPPQPEPQCDTTELTAKIAETRKRTADHLASYASPTQRDGHSQAAWAAGVARIAAETIADLDNLPPQERHSATIWAEALNACANDLMTSDPLPRMRPGDLAGFMQPGAP
jgi:hypothetical protein